MRSGSVARVARATAVAVTVASSIGVIAALTLGAFVLDRYDAYGEVPIPGTGKLHLPAGRVTVSFHTVTVGNSGGGGLPVPHLMLDIDPPAGVAAPKVTEDVGGSTSVNNDIHRRVWSAVIPVDGDYIVTTRGDVSGYISPRMAFGRDSDSSGTWLATAVGLLVVGLVGTVLSSVWLSRTKPARQRVWRSSAPPPVGTFVTPTGEAVRLEQLKTLAALRDSGALTEKEFQAEKRRVLGSD